MARKRVAKHWMLYAMGGGYGHFTRGIALARAICAEAAAAGETIHPTVLTNCPLAFQQTLAHEWSGVRIRHVDAPRAASMRVKIRSILAEDNFDVFVADCFPRGLGGELVEMLSETSALRVLTHRDLNPRYIEQFDLAPFVTRNYDVMLSPGEQGLLANVIPTIATTPWLIREADDLATRNDARTRLGASQGRPLVAVVASGKTAEQSEFRDLAQQLATALRGDAIVRLIHPPLSDRSLGTDSQTIPLWPLLPWMRGVDVLVGAGGYNTVAEARATKTPFVAVARPRRYDRQAKRLGDAQVASDFASILRAARKKLSECNENERRCDYRNGARDAARQMIQFHNAACAALEETLR